MHRPRLWMRGLFCPEPIFRAKTEIDSLKVGEALKIIADDPAAEEDITRWTKRTGNEILSFQKEGKHLTFVVRRTN